MSERKHVLVTGASGGIGQSIAQYLAEKGYEVVVHFGRNEAEAKKIMEIIEAGGGVGRLLNFDVTHREETREKLEMDMRGHGAYYGIVSNIGIMRDAPFPGMEDKDWDDVINVNLNGFYNVIRPCIIPMIKRRRPGRIVAVTSISGDMGNRGQTNYSASKAAIVGAAKSMAVELARRSITVNCVSPGLIDTPMVSEEVWHHAKKLIPMERKGTTKEVASMVGYLMSDEASYITRQVISVNGGMF